MCADYYTKHVQHVTQAGKARRTRGSIGLTYDCVSVGYDILPAMLCEDGIVREMIAIINVECKHRAD